MTALLHHPLMGPIAILVAEVAVLVATIAIVRAIDVAIARLSRAMWRGRP